MPQRLLPRFFRARGIFCGELDADFGAGVFGAADGERAAQEGRAHFHAGHAKVGLAFLVREGAAVGTERDSDSVVKNHYANFALALLDYNSGLLRLGVGLGVVERLLDYAHDVAARLGGKAFQVNFGGAKEFAFDRALL